MECREAMEKLDSYIECELSELEAFNVRKHLDNCSVCRQEYNEMEEVFFTLSDHNIEMLSFNFTNRILDEVCVYEKNKTFKEVVLLKGVTSVVAGVIISMTLSITHYKPLNLFSSIYKSSTNINKIILNPIEKISKGMKEIAELF